MFKKKKERTKVKIKYSDQLKNPYWIRKRNHILKRDKYTCTTCHRQDILLNVHHIYYIKDSMAWQYPHKALITLCDNCHRKWHKTHDLEVREIKWNKNKDYKAPEKNKKWVSWKIKREPEPSLSELQVSTRYRKKVNGKWEII